MISAQHFNFRRTVIRRVQSCEQSLRNIVVKNSHLQIVSMITLNLRGTRLHLCCQTLITMLILIISCVQGLTNENSVNCERINRNCETNADVSSNTIYFGLMLSFPDPQNRHSLVGAFDDGHDIAPAAYLAVEQINNRSDLLSDYQIKLMRIDGGCNVTERSAIGINDLSCSCKAIMGIIGPTCGTSSMVIGKITGKQQFSLITIHYGQDEILGNRTLFPFSFGILGSTAKYVDAVIELVKVNHWKRLAVLYSEDDIYIARSRKIQEKVKKLHNYNISFASAIYDNYIPLKEISETFTRVIILIGTPGISLRTICLAYHEKMVFPNYQWVFVERTDSDFHNISFNFNGKSFNCSSSDIGLAINGSINILFGAVSEDDNRAVSEFGVTLQQYQQGYRMHIEEYIKEFNAHSTEVEWGKGFYDAVWSLAFALNNSLEEVEMNLTQLKTGSNSFARALAKHMVKLNFTGISGRINFDSETGYNTNTSVSLYQYTNHLKSYSKRIGVCTSDNFTLFSETHPKFINAHFEEKTIHVNISVAAILLSFTIFVFVLASPLQIVYIVYRDYKSIKASSPWMSNLIFAGCYFIAFSTLLYLLIETFKHLSLTLREHLCNVIPWFLTTGTTMIMGTILVKTWRLHRIYTHSKRMNRESIRLMSKKLLVGVVIFLVLLDVIVCTIWTSTDRLKLSRGNKLLHFDADEYPVIAVYDSCDSKHIFYWVGVLLAPKVALTLSSFFLALFTRFNIKEFTTKNVVILVYLLTIVSGLMIPTYAIIIINNVEITIRVAIACLFLNLIVYITILFSLIPPIHAFVMAKHH